LVSFPTQMPLWTREPQQQGFINKYKDNLFLINNKVNYFIALVPVEHFYLQVKQPE
jgi:hypothetical protein